MAPKLTSSGKTVLHIAGNLAVCIFNDGISKIMQIMAVLGMTIGPNCYNFCIEADNRRIKLSDRSLTEAAKTSRLALQSARKDEEEESVNIEG